MNKLTADFFINNRIKLRRVHKGNGLIVLTAYARLQLSTDVPFTFRQESSFWYFTGLDEPEVILVIDGDKEYLILPTRSKFSDISNGEINQDELASISGVIEILTMKAGWERLSKRLKNLKQVSVLLAPPAYIDECDFYTNPARAKLMEDIKSYNQAIEFNDIRLDVARLRSIKQPIEIEQIQTAINITNESFVKIKNQLPKLNYEHEIEAIILETFYKHGSKPAFESVVTSGKKACQIHSEEKHSPLLKTDLVVIDIGAEVNHYCADVARTYSIGSPSVRQKQIHASVATAQQFAFSLLKPGISYRDYEAKMEKFIGQELKALGVIKTATKKEIRRHFPHATSHFLGLDTHDSGDYYSPLEPGMVLAVEPGIYIAEEGIGVRIEDDVLITSEGISILSANLPLTIN